MATSLAVTVLTPLVSSFTSCGSRAVAAWAVVARPVSVYSGVLGAVVLPGVMTFP